MLFSGGYGRAAARNTGAGGWASKRSVRHRVLTGKPTPLPARLLPGKARRPAHLVVPETSESTTETCGVDASGFRLLTQNE